MHSAVCWADRSAERMVDSWAGWKVAPKVDLKALPMAACWVDQSVASMEFPLVGPRADRLALHLAEQRVSKTAETSEA